MHKKRKESDNGGNLKCQVKVDRGCLLQVLVHVQVHNLVQVQMQVCNCTMFRYSGTSSFSGRGMPLEKWMRMHHYLESPGNAE